MRILFFVLTFFLVFTSLAQEKKTDNDKNNLETTGHLTWWMLSHGHSACCYALDEQWKPYFNFNWTKSTYRSVKESTNEIFAFILSAIIAIVELIIFAALLLFITVILMYGAIVMIIGIVVGIVIVVWNFIFG